MLKRIAAKAVKRVGIDHDVDNGGFAAGQRGANGVADLRLLVDAEARRTEQLGDLVAGRMSRGRLSTTGPRRGDSAVRKASRTISGRRFDCVTVHVFSR